MDTGAVGLGTAYPGGGGRENFMKDIQICSLVASPLLFGYENLTYYLQPEINMYILKDAFKGYNIWTN